MRSAHWAHGLWIVATLAATSFSQQAANSVAKSAAKVSAAPAKPKLTEKQKQGLRMLDAAQTEAAALQPDMRAFIEWQVSMGYLKYDPKKSDELLERAFTSTSELTSTATGNCWTGHDEPCRVKHWLQSEIIDEMVKRSPNKGEDLASRLEPEMREAVNYRLLETYLEKNDLAKAKEVLDRFAAEGAYPFSKAATLMEKIPESHRDEKWAIFSQALASYKQYNDLGSRDDDFPSVLVRCWKQLPPAMVLDAIDAILAKSKEDLSLNNDPVTIMTSHHGNIHFTSGYNLRIFELLPILRELDSSHADQLIREHPDVQATLNKFPNGVQSIDSNFGHEWSEKDEDLPEIVNFGELGGDDAESEEQSYLFQQNAKIWDEVARDPKQALALAYSLPETTPLGHHPRLSAFLTVAEKTSKKDPNVCRIALSEIRKEIDNSKPMWATDQLLEVASKYQELGDLDNARSTLDEAVKNVDQLYKEDSDSSDPNVAFKGNWPSTHLWSACLRLAAQVSPQMQEKIMSEIPDPEIASFLKVMYANGLLGASHSRGIVAVIHKNKRSYYGMRS